MFIWIYRLCFLPALLIIAPVMLWKNRHREGHWQAVRLRLSGKPEIPPRRRGIKRVWLQAVSVGEVLAVEPVLAELTSRGDVEVVLTTTTSTGYRLAREKYADRVSAISYFPIDAWWAVAKTWRRVRPDLFVLMEGERWPEHLHAAVRHNVPVVVINARLSDRSFRRMRALGSLGRGLFRGITRVMAAAPQDAERFAEFGIAREAISVTGNLKLDTQLPELTDAEKAALRSELGFQTRDRIVVGASTWPGEEKALLRACCPYWQAGEDSTPVKLLLVPRHAERRAEVVSELKSAKVTYHVRSRGVAKGEVQVSLADTTGELARLVQLGDIVWIGKSLPPHTEGQTPVEAARLGRPVLFGPSLSNFRRIAETLRERGAARAVPDAAGMASALRELLASDSSRAKMGAAGRAWHETNRGANERTLQGLLNMLEALEPKG